MGGIGGSAGGFFVRGAVAALGALAVAWAGSVFAVSPFPGALDRAADRIIRGEPYKPEELERVGPLIGASKSVAGARASLLRSAAIVELSQAETAIAEGRRAAIDDRLGALGRSLERSLTTAPADPFLWLVMYWRANAISGFDPAHLDYLAASYRLGPNEGWIGVRRMRLALAVFPRLPDALRTNVVAEFAGLVNSRFSEMPDILVGPGWTARDALLPNLDGADERSRKLFARAVYALGYDIVVPGIERPDARPWSR